MSELAGQESGLAEYLAADEVIDHEHGEIRALAARLREQTPEATARALYEYVRDAVPHSAEVAAQEWSGVYRASEVLAAGNAICHGKAHLLVALLRAEGIPAGVRYQRFEVLHGLAAAWWPGEGWVDLDPRGNFGGVAAEFAVRRGEGRIAFPETPVEDGVYAAVPAGVARALATAVPGVADYGYLPDRVR
ncbi:transglutaminase-like domain-containing protein [Kitasatospora sp. NPDC002227]|uniref:transglutaminase-like domain-containing protein n=1 Tax=Kitasatospora sp. NPDC002227 TaxID=3154773 RepID=UPI0033196535